jgi:hypothetical protein
MRLWGDADNEVADVGRGEEKGLRIFIASPGDTQDLRETVARVAEKLNKPPLPQEQKTISLLRWETDVVSSVGGYVQDVINKQIPDYDVLVVIFRKRFGTPTPLANSGTEEEFERAYRRLANSSNPVEIMVYVSDEALPLSSINPFQLALVQHFKQHAYNLGVLVQSFRTVQEFETLIERGLSRLVKPSVDVAAKSAPTTVSVDFLKLVTQLGPWHAKTRKLYPQWGTFFEIPILEYLRHPISLTGTLFTSSPYFRFGVKTMMNEGNPFGKDTVQTNDANVMLHLGLNMDRPYLFLSPFKNGMRLDENLDLLDYSKPRPVPLKIDYLSDGIVKFYCDGELKYELYSPLEFRQRMLLLAWGDHNDYDIEFANIAVTLLE